MLRRLVYNVSTQKFPFDFSAQMYGQYRAYCERHVAEHVLAADGRPDPARLDLIGRLGGDGYVRTTDRFELKRP